jgi:DNA-binding response OmpR family regulator
MEQGTGHKRILIIEDETETRDAYRNYLRHLGHEVVAAGNAQDAARLARNTKPDVVICDWQLAKGESGIEVARKIQKHLVSRIIFVTAKPLREIRRAARAIQVQCFLRKPVNLSKLAELVEGRPCANEAIASRAGPIAS